MKFDPLAFKLARPLLAAGVLLATLPGHAETVNLQQAVAMSLAADPRIKEREQVVEAARGLLQEVQGNMGFGTQESEVRILSPRPLFLLLTCAVRSAPLRSGPAVRRDARGVFGQTTGIDTTHSAEPGWVSFFRSFCWR